MARIRLIHWKEAEADMHFKALNAARCEIEYEERLPADIVKRWRQSPPDAFVIDLSRMPSHGREIAIGLRQSKSTRSVPIVFCAGDPEKVNAIRKLLPDASYCDVRSLARTVRKCLNSKCADPIVPTAMMDRYKSRTTAEKLGVKIGSTVVVTNAPRDFENILGPLPAEIKLCESDTGDAAADVHVCFVHRPDDLASNLSGLRSFAQSSKLWIAWRKGGKAVAGAVTENLVRNQALDLGLVDYKICSMNNTWSAILFTIKR